MDLRKKQLLLLCTTLADWFCVTEVESVYSAVRTESLHETDTYRGAVQSLARPTSRCILFDGENISFDASLVLFIYLFIYIYIYVCVCVYMYINSTNIPPIMIINRIYDHQNLLSL